MPARHLKPPLLICRPLGLGLAPGACYQLFVLVAVRDHILVHWISGNGHMAEVFFGGYDAALRRHTPDAALASYPGLRGGAGIIYLMN